jgi:hypothetical protein
MLDLIKKIFLMDWLWKIFAGFYLVAYAFWVPALFDSLPLIVLVISATLILGLGLLADGFSKALELEYRIPALALPFRRIWLTLGAVFLFGYLMVYIPPGGRVVAHWPLDLAITLLSAAVLLAYAIWDIE